eukprot:scaffold15298_cov49-Attheya_sp.AAC.4
MSTPPSADTVDTVPSIVKGALTHTTHDPNAADVTTHTPPDPTVAVATPLGTRTNRYRHSKPTSTTAAVGG